ncbi:hypothetical protein D9611_013762 [Ephemerocybe angulata]|uniref:Ubiquitin-like domain-containing protein n=1 Tax=Ephemerocybe angulata TaxID=980116 RepID=A0A8H5F276_9AGAR|nr:hypothetical protein D9611_013762 [Tulosesus angulatus]
MKFTLASLAKFSFFIAASCSASHAYLAYDELDDRSMTDIQLYSNLEARDNTGAAEEYKRAIDDDEGHLEARSRINFQVKLSLTGQVLGVEFDKATKIEHFRKEISNRLGLTQGSPKDLVFVLGSTKLDNDKKTLQDYKVDTGNTIMMTFAMKAGKGADLIDDPNKNTGPIVYGKKPAAKKRSRV